ncbi:MAG TPA: tetraacyldisaccharide 4'-kinase [Casimicrobiaceae bacterium]|nr:tetraacyldisaccharide 4'-kinase [Casimicrobiaceae bacterium]
MSLSDHLLAAWFSPGLTPLSVLLAPAALAFRAATVIRRGLYRRGVFRTEHLPVPVIVVGNITVGGSGKTPLTIALASELASRGWHPGIVSRGYRATTRAPRAVGIDDDPDAVGDEPLLLARTGLPVWIGADRPAAARALLAAHPDRDLIIADDGLQHYALARDIEIAVIDASRGLGNGLPLPAGPLREPPARLGAVDAIVYLGGAGDSRREFAMTLAGERFVRLDDTAVSADAVRFRSGEVHAVAGIGDPKRFFAQLAALGIAAHCHPFPDHHRYVPADLALPGATAILMTEKDAVKCRRFADDRCWALPVSATVDPALIALVERGLRGRKTA